MSYNITRLKIRKIHLELPIDFNFHHWLLEQPDRDEDGDENTGKRWCLEDENTVLASIAMHTWTLSLSAHEISGTIEGNKLFAKELDLTGDGSGPIYADILIPLFKEFKGILDAIVVWEGGDTVAEIHVHDGVLEENIIV